MPTCTLLTCSMARDIELFALLAESVDRFVPQAVQHRVIVPAADVTAFARFGNVRRQIVSQDDVLPFRARKLPKTLGHLSPIVGALRRPLYLTPGFNLVRGWVLQQILKIEATRTSDADVVLHVDSDVFFVRFFETEMVLPGGRPTFFHVPAESLSAEHDTWTAVADRILGIATGTVRQGHYVENCIPWSPKIVRRMTDQIVQTNKRAWHDVLMQESSFSEYFIYGRFVNVVDSVVEVEARSNTVCKTYWSDIATSFAQDMNSIVLPGDQVALAIQSTEDVSVADRRRMFERYSSDT